MSLVLSMTLRFVPRFSAQARRVSRAQAAVGNDMHAGSPVHRVKCALMVFSILVTWSLENAVDTADSMRAPGLRPSRKKRIFDLHTHNAR